MKKLLMYENRKSAPLFWDISTPELQEGAVRALFRHLDNDWRVYSGLDDLVEPQTPGMAPEEAEQLPEGPIRDAALKEINDYDARLRNHMRSSLEKSLYERARSGEYPAMLALLKARKGYEYESWRIFPVQEGEPNHAS